MGIVVRMAINGMAGFVLNTNRYITQPISNSQTTAPVIRIAFSFAWVFVNSEKSSLDSFSAAIIIVICSKIQECNLIGIYTLV